MPVPADLVQVRAASDGTLAPVEGDVFDVCARIHEVDPSLGVELNVKSGLYRIYELCDDGKKRTVKWVRELTPDLPDYLRRLKWLNFGEELERIDAQAKRDEDHKIHEIVGPLGEKLGFAGRKDLGLKGKVFVPRWP